ncbi:MAG: acyl-CoA-binding protein [Chitinophagales bacterium]|nr:acyl-CoA-binding protein [Chitinophagales bacterium]
MSLKEQFADAQVRVRTLTTRPSNEDLLQLYALFKQATEGDNNTKKPGMFDIKEQFKWKTWSELKGTSSDGAMQQYIDLVNKLLGV